MAKLKITQIRSRIGNTERQCKNLDALGLRRMHRSVIHENSARILGMIEKVQHLVRVEEVKEAKKEKVKKAVIKPEEQNNGTQ